MARKPFFGDARAWTKEQIATVSDGSIERVDRSPGFRKASSAGVSITLLALLVITIVGLSSYLSRPDVPSICEMARQASNIQVHIITHDNSYDPSWTTCTINAANLQSQIEDFDNDPAQSPSNLLYVVLSGWYTDRNSDRFDLRAEVFFERNTQTDQMTIMRTIIK